MNLDNLLSSLKSGNLSLNERRMPSAATSRRIAEREKERYTEVLIKELFKLIKRESKTGTRRVSADYNSSKCDEEFLVNAFAVRGYRTETGRSYCSGFDKEIIIRF